MPEEEGPQENHEENQETEDTQTPEGEQTPQIEAEPEGGPLDRQRAFLEERLSTLKPKEEVDEGEEEAELFGGLADAPATPEEEPEPPTEPEVMPAEQRRRLMEQYRQRQRAQLDAESGPQPGDPEEEQPADGGEDEDEGTDDPSSSALLGLGDAGSAPPEPPQPAPANNWVPIGPAVLRRGQAATQPATSGRTPAIAVAPGGTRLYAASANGGVWRSEDTGHSWMPLMNAFDLNPQTVASDSLACGAIALVPGATASQDRLYVGSGEGAGAAYFGVGPIVSTDGGTNWVTEPVSGTSPALAGTAFYALAVDPADADRVVGATRRGIYRRQPSGAGFEWDRKSLPSAGSTWATSVVASRSGGTTTFYAATWRGPVYRSTDGHTWNALTNGFPTSNVGRIGLAAQPDDPDTVYALIHNDSNGAVLGVWRYDAGDNSWRQVTGHPPFLFGNPDPFTSPGTQGWYDLAIAVDPNNANRIYLGGSTVASGGAWSASLYRCDVSSSGSGAGLTYSMTPHYIGASVHADVHTIVFAPGDSNKLWVGCDGGLFYATNPTGSGDIFTPRNTGLATLTMEYLAQHPTEDAVLFCGTQDNGGARFTGEEAWLHSVWGDSGFFVINWNDPYQVVSTYTRSSVNRTNDGGTRYNYTSVSVPVPPGEPVLFYAPLVGTPYNPGNPAQAERIAFGSTRPWVSETFGGGWQSLPNGTTADRLGTGNAFRIKSLLFASHDKLYAGLMNGRVYRYEETAAGWTRTRIDDVGGANALPLSGVVSDIAVDPADASGNSIYITFGGTGDYRHVWHFDGTQWRQRSGPSPGHANSLLDIQHNAIVVDPVNTAHLYVGADIGVWHSTDGGASWEPFSHGLPDAGVLDLQLHNPRRLLRASTHGRGVFERTLNGTPKLGVELYLRDTQLDQGRVTTMNGLPDPTQKGETVRHWRGPDIKLDTPDVTGQYQFPPTESIDFLQFVDALSDDFQNVATHATATITTRVYVQVHNRGIETADDVRVMLLLCNASAGLPALPPGYEANVQTGTPINTADWKTVGMVDLDGVRADFPQIAAFDLTSDLLPPPTSLAGNDHHCVLALIHHTQDPYTSTETNTDTNSRQERKAAHKNLKVVQFTGTVPAPPPTVMAVRLNNANLAEEALSDLVLTLNGYPGRVRLVTTPLETEGDLDDLMHGLETSQDDDDFQTWAQRHRERIERNQQSDHPYDELWARQQVTEIQQASQAGLKLGVENKDRAALRRIKLEPGSHRTLFLMFDRPANGQIGDSHEVQVLQIDSESEEVLGGLTARVELVPQPEVRSYRLKLFSHRWLFGFVVVRAQLYDPQDQLLTPDDGAQAHVALGEGAEPEGPARSMRFHSGWRAFFRYVHVGDPAQTRARVTMRLNGVEIIEGELPEL